MSGDQTISKVDLTISIATWNNRDLLADCLRSIEGQIGAMAVEVFVVDNTSGDGTAEMVRREFPWVRLIANESPRGFSTNHNQVLRRASGRHALLLNDDTVVQKDALEQAARFLDEHPDVGAVGCTLIKPDGTPERISQRFPHPLDPLFPHLRQKVDPRREKAAGLEPVEVDRLSGACLMVRRAALERVGLLDEQFDPAYGEDTDLCYRIKQAGWRIYRLRQARVIHYRGQTARRELPDQARRLQEGKLRWYRKHRGRGELCLYRAAVVVASAVQILFCLPQWLIPSRRADARARIRRLWSRLGTSLGCP